MKLPRRRLRTSAWQLGTDAIDQLSADPGPWLSCDDCFARSDVEIETMLSAGDLFPADFLAHLRTCGACCAEARTLLELSAEDAGGDVKRATDRFDAMVGAPAR